jgi:hypothetical protein
MRRDFECFEVGPVKADLQVIVFLFSIGVYRVLTDTGHVVIVGGMRNAFIIVV